MGELKKESTTPAALPPSADTLRMRSAHSHPTKTQKEQAEPSQQLSTQHSTQSSESGDAVSKHREEQLLLVLQFPPVMFFPP